MSIDPSLVPAAFAQGAGARFVARPVDTQQAPLVEVLKRADAHVGTAFIEIFQHSVVFNDGVFETSRPRTWRPSASSTWSTASPCRSGPSGGRGSGSGPAP